VGEPAQAVGVVADVAALPSEAVDGGVRHEEATGPGQGGEFREGNPFAGWLAPDETRHALDKIGVCVAAFRIAVNAVDLGVGAAVPQHLPPPCLWPVQDRADAAFRLCGRRPDLRLRLPVMPYI
jgi:hypothetical protein